jgi:hypothetical protein
LVGGGEQDADLLGGERRWRVGGDGMWFGVGGGVGRQVVPFHRVAERLVQAKVQLADGAGTKPARRAVLATVLGQLVVQPLHLQGGKRAQEEGAEVGAQVVLEQLAAAADGSQPQCLVGLEVSEPVVQQVVERRRCRPTNDNAWVAWTAAVAPERLVECRSRGGLGGVAAEVVEPAPAVAVRRGALDARVPGARTGPSTCLVHPRPALNGSPT